MEELQPEELQALVQELKGEVGEEEAPSPEAEQLLQDLEPERPMELKVEAVRQLSELSSSNPRIVETLAAASMWDASPKFRRFAAASLLAPAHQAVVEQHPDLLPQHVKNLLREIEEGGLEEAIVEPEAEIEELLRVLQSDGTYLVRRRAAEQLGEVGRSSRKAVLALLEAAESDPTAEVRAMAAESLGAPVHQVILEQCPELGQRAQTAARRPAAARERKKAVAGEMAHGRLLGLGVKRWGIVNAAFCGLLVVATVASFLLSVFGKGDAGMFAAIMLLAFIPIACIPIGISCLVGALRARAVFRRHPSQEAQIGLRLSVRGPIAVLACYVLGLGILLLVF